MTNRNIVTTRKFMVMPIMLPFQADNLILPGTRPMLQRQGILGGEIKWSVSEWDKAEYERIEGKVNTLKGQGMSIETFTQRIAELMSLLLPDRDFSVTIGSFSIEYEHVKEKRQ
jgi:hypothetical protein